MRNIRGTRHFVTALAAAVCLTAVAACGDTKPQTQAQPGAYPSATATSQPSPAASQMPGMSMSPTGAPSGPAVATQSVKINQFAFGPQSITVKVGTTVTWTNGDQDSHTVTSQGNSGPLKSATLGNGDTYKYTFTKAGTYEYLCTIHPFMTGTVVVTA
jgi:plastocyanin